jgi:segregation and condensation protein B
MGTDGIKAAIEALLFSSDKPVLIEQIRSVFSELEPAEIRNVLEELKKDWETASRGMRIVEVANGFQMVTAPDFSSYLKKYYKQKHPGRLSRSALETLAIIAYKQPVTRLEIESIRGVNVDGVVSHLKELGVIRISGRKQAPGRPFVYSTTREFLEYFGLRSLEELPKMENFSSLAGPEAAGSDNKVEAINEPEGPGQKEVDSKEPDRPGQKEEVLASQEAAEKPEESNEPQESEKKD